MRQAVFVCLVIFAAGAIGCRSTQSRTYSVAVVNAADQDVVLWLTKDGGPYEEQWMTPSQWHELKTRKVIPEDVPDPAVKLPPGMRVDLGPQSGKFNVEASAVLLVYSTPVSLEEMAATPRNTGLMDVVFLQPGQNNVMVRDTLPVRAERVVRLEGRPAGEPAAPGGPP